MSLNQLLLAELEREAANTRKILKNIPADKMEWRPHERSFTLSRMASHVAEIPRWLTMTITTDAFDMATSPVERNELKTAEAMLQMFDAEVEEAKAALQTATDEQLGQRWVLSFGDRVISDTSRYEAIRNWMFNHHIHHRGQLSVYLRLLDVPVPGMYGPSADDRAAAEKAKAATTAAS